MVVYAWIQILVERVRLVVVEGRDIGGGDGEVGLRFGTSEPDGGGVVGAGGLLGGAERAEPEAGLLERVSDFSRKLPPRPPPHAPVPN